MFTILYFAEDGSDHWDRFESKAELLAFIDEHGLREDGDLQIYGPEADNYLMSVEDVERSEYQ